MGNAKSIQKTCKTTYHPPVTPLLVGLSFGAMEDYLRRSLKATDDELTYLKRILHLRTKERSSLTWKQNIYSYPSIIIDDFLYHGNFDHASNINLLNELNIRHIISLCDCSLGQIVMEKFNVLRINVTDELKVNIKEHFDKTNQFLYNCKQKNEKTLVHCQMGISRSSTIILAYLMKFHHNSLFTAYDYLLERRRMAFPNYSFFLQLIRYEKELQAIKIDDETKTDNEKLNTVENLQSKHDTHFGSNDN